MKNKFPNQVAENVYFFWKLIFFAFSTFSAILAVSIDRITQPLITKNIEGVAVWAKSAGDVHVTSSHTT